MRVFSPLLLAASLLSWPAAAQNAEPSPRCVPVGAWVRPDGTPPADLFGGLSKSSVVLLGEQHSNPEHHRWQLQMLAGLLALHPDLVIGFEMFPRRIQPVLDRWVAGELTEAQFLDDSEWRKFWRFDPQLYLPIFHFARMNRIRMVALNIEEALVHRVGAEGWQSVPPSEREGIADPAEAEPAYLASLQSVFSGHGGQSPPDAAPDPARVERFVEAQLLWDAAMAQGIEAARGGSAKPLVVGIVGEGHIEHRYGIPHQLAAHGIADAAVLLPWGPDRDCAELKPGIADEVFGVAAAEAAPKPPRLGVAIATGEGPPRIDSVAPDSVAARTGLQKYDIITEAAGTTLASYDDLTAIVGRQAPGTWLPLKVKRGDAVLDLVAEFPR